MDIRIKKSKFKGSISSIPSKSALHRLLICSAFSDKITKIENSKVLSEDIAATIACLRKMGAKINILNNNIEVTPINKKIDEINIDVKESGTTLRLLLPLANVVANRVIINASPSLRKRPINDLINLLKDSNIKVIKDDYPLILEGSFNGNKVELPGNITSQYFSSLLLLSGVLNKDFTISSISEIESFNYIEMTLDTLRDFSCNFNIYKENNKTSFKLIKEKEKEKENANSKINTYLKSKGIYTCEGDYSNMATFLILGILNGEIKVTNLNNESSQGDKYIVKLLKEIGGDIEVKDKEVIVKESKVKPFNLSFNRIPDLFPVISVLALATGCKCILNGGERLKYKESNRIKSTFELLKNAGANVTLLEDGIEVNGFNKDLNNNYNNNMGNLNPIVVDSHNDHRIVMAAAILRVIVNRDIIVKDAEAINKSYMNFIEEYKKLGGQVDVINV